MAVWLVGMVTDNVKLAEVAGMIVIVSCVIVIGSSADIKLYNNVRKDKNKEKRKNIK